ncbi:MAG: glycosyltransferase family 4 protein [Chitinophagaceae bacterium]|nr:glycosyltransferase family 4 protein [Chitinophagaceae bacterium]
MEVILVRETWSHMANVSGFDPLFSGFETHQSVQADSFFVSDFANAPKINRLARLIKPATSINIQNALSPFVEVKHERLAQALVKRMKEKPNAFVFLSVTENQLAPSLSALPESLLHRFVLFVHQPPAWFRLFWKDMHVFSKVKAVVCLCEAQASFFEAHQSAPVIRIHHGVNLEFFTPQYNKTENAKKIIFVGQWMRDMDTLARTFFHLTKRQDGISLHCVLQRRFRNHPALLSLAQLPNVFWYDHIHANQLKALYQSANLMLLPLIDSTANNAFVEAAACGLPVVSTHVGGASEYVYAPAARLVEPMNAEAMADACIELLAQFHHQSNWPKEIRQFAEKTFHWPSQVDHCITALNAII